MTSIGAHFPAWQQAQVRHYLYTLRKQFGMSVEDLAKEVGYSTSVINAMERGYRAPSFVELSEWAQAFGLRVFLAPITKTSKPGEHDRMKREQCIDEQRSVEAA